MENKSHALAAGAFVILVTAMLIGLAAWLMRDTRIRDALEFSTRESVTGLQPQAAVRYRGIAVGKVESIEFDPQVRGNVLVRLAINQGTPLTKSTYATLGYQGVTGLAYVQLDDSGESQELLNFSAGSVPRIPLKPSLLSKLSDQGTNILMGLEEVTQRVNQLLAPVNQKALIDSFAAISTSATAVGASANNFSQQITAMQKILDAQFGPERVDIPALVRETRQSLQTLQSTSQEFSKTASETNKAVASINQISQRLLQSDGTLDRVNEGIAAVTRSVQTLGQSAQQLNSNMLPRTSRMMEDVSRTSRTVDRVVQQLGDSPQSLIFGNAPIPPGPGESGFRAPAK